MGEKDLFKTNDLYELIRGIPAYPTPSNEYEWNLGYRRVFKWSQECRSDELYTMPEVKRRF